jgi:hypothetical protein
MTKLISRAEGSPPIDDEQRLMDRLEDVFGGRLLLEMIKKYIGWCPLPHYRAMKYTLFSGIVYP